MGSHVILNEDNHDMASDNGVRKKKNLLVQSSHNTVQCCHCVVGSYQNIILSSTSQSDVVKVDCEMIKSDNNDIHLKIDHSKKGQREVEG